MAKKKYFSSKMVSSLPMKSYTKDYPVVDTYLQGDYGDTMADIDAQMMADAGKRRKGAQKKVVKY